ncbi:MAG TPA: magnesium transporter [Spirochaetota bacterium]|nr:magnesium transporter [Spirochaetota bacterium]HOL57963.1 magnesium transporter [Spirochaetota bacterium]HPP05489.1 magnesium transporter [Spirochaetota bacterium]
MNILKNLLWPEIEELIDLKEWKILKNILSEWDIPNLVELIKEVDDKNKIIIFRILPKNISNELFSEIDYEDQKVILSKMTDQQIKEILLELEPDDRTMLFEELPGKILQKYLNLLPDEERKEALELFGYPEESVGRLMTPNYTAVRPEWTIKKALEHIKERGYKSETINVIYITDEKWHFLDALELKKFILASPELLVKDIMDYIFVTLSPYDDREKAVSLMRHYNLSALPVVDSDNILVGIVTFDDVMDVAKEEATEDFHKTAGILPLEENYLKIDIRKLFLKRIGWLLSLVFINIFSGAIISRFENLIMTFVALVFFMPLLNDSAGNAGSQSATLIIRFMATNEMKWKDGLIILLKDFFVAILLAIAMGISVFLLGMFRGGIRVSIVASLAMFTIIVISSILGTILPLILKAFRIDPATASSPLITSLADIISVTVYFTIAKIILF